MLHLTFLMVFSYSYSYPISKSSNTFSPLYSSHHFHKFQIELVEDLPVGDNLQDHLMIYPFDYLLDKPLAITGQRAESFSEFMKYTLFGEGSYKNIFKKNTTER